MLLPAILRGWAGTSWWARKAPAVSAWAPGRQGGAGHWGPTSITGHGGEMNRKLWKNNIEIHYWAKPLAVVRKWKLRMVLFSNRAAGFVVTLIWDTQTCLLLSLLFEGCKYFLEVQQVHGYWLYSKEGLLPAGSGDEGLWLDADLAGTLCPPAARLSRCISLPAHTSQSATVKKDCQAIAGEYK